MRGKVEGCSLDRFESATGLKLMDDNGIKDELPPITTFLNRMLALTIDLQNILFDAFEGLLVHRIEARHGQAQWVAVSDTDEFWWDAGGTLRDLVSRVPANAIGLYSDQKLFLPTAIDPSEGPPYVRRTWRTTGPSSPLHTSYRSGKSIYRASWVREHELTGPHWCVAVRGAAYRPPRALVHRYGLDEDFGAVWGPEDVASVPTYDNFINHACEPSLAYDAAGDVVAGRELRAGDELTCEYGAAHVPERFDCACGAPTCRGGIVVDDLPGLFARWDRESAEALAWALTVDQPVLAAASPHDPGAWIVQAILERRPVALPSWADSVPGGA